MSYVIFIFIFASIANIYYAYDASSLIYLFIWSVIYAVLKNVSPMQRRPALKMKGNLAVAG